MRGSDGIVALSPGGGPLDRFLDSLLYLPDSVVYAVVAACAAVENVFPPIPADVVALFGGFLAGRGTPNPWIMFAVVWAGNAGSAMVTYWMGRRYGTRFFAGRIGRAVLHPGQLARLAAFYGRHGLKVIFVSRFLPGFRALVPVFAGTSGLGALRTFIPIALASGLWYGAIVYAGATAGRNWEEIRGALDTPGRLMALAAVLLALAVAWAWRRTRDRSESGSDGAAHV